MHELCKNFRIELAPIQTGHDLVEFALGRSRQLGEHLCETLNVFDQAIDIAVGLRQMFEVLIPPQAFQTMVHSGIQCFRNNLVGDHVERPQKEKNL